VEPTDAKPAGSPILELTHVTKVFKYDILKPRQTAVNNLSCQFPEGACTGLLGHNGAGKTTTIRLILGLLKPDEGAITYRDQKITTEAKASIGYMPEVNKLAGGLTCEEVLHHHLRLYAPAEYADRAARRKAVDRKLEEVNLTAHRKKKVGKLSKGMGRRLAWAQATIHDPKLLILDEPSSGLDPLGRVEMLEWIAAEKNRGTSIILCTHELAQISYLCDQFHVLRRGQLVMTSIADSATKAGSDCRLYDWGQKYALHVSGVDEASINALARQQQLQQPQRIRQAGMSAVLGFDSYELAAQWMRAMLAAGCMILKFSEEMVLTEDDVAVYYRNEVPK
jgi:ABC-2 type transport system ATP-binding protein